MADTTPDRRRADPSANWAGNERRRLFNAVGSGRGIADLLDPAAEEAYWRENYETQPYYEAGYAYDDYHPAYRAGWEGRVRHEGRSFEQVERELEADYNRNRGSSRLTWDQCRVAARAAWDRFDATDDFERSQ
jgi:hypothetical protein